MARLTLTPDELHEVTDLEQPAAQIRWLTSNKWPFVIGASGRPKVSRAFYEEASRQRSVPRAAPIGSDLDFAALDAVMHKR